MMKKKAIRLIIFMVAVLLGTATAHSADYSSKKLEHIATLLRKPVNRVDTVQRINEYGEIEHIGLRLFSKEIRETMPSPVYDFLERYLLELNITQGEEHSRLLFTNNVSFLVGQPSTALAIDSSCAFSNEQIDFYHYRSTWTKEGKEILKVVFPMSWKMMSGCSLSELETGFEKRLLRHKVTKVVPLPIKGTYIISPVIKNDLYLENGDDDGEERKYIFSIKQKSRSVANLMLAEDLPVDVTLRVVIDRYDYITDTLSVPLHTFQNFCIVEEGCKPYFGLKNRSGNITKGVLMLANKNGGFLHMLSVSIDDSVLENGKGVIEGRLMPYIPLHNVKKEFVNLTEYETIQ